jgi:ubiquitin carboxyl-terminal hydrolase L5
MADNGWCTIESDPSVFSEMIAQFGVKGIRVEELVANDASMTMELGAGGADGVLGLVFLFKYTSQIARLPRNVMADAQNVYFAKQIVGNACATQAIINTLLNNADSVDLGENLRGFYDFSKELPPDMRGEQIGENEVLRSVHNSFTRASMFSFEDDTRRRNAKEEENFHFVTYTYKDGAVWELDGLRDGPVFIDQVDKDGWVELACSAIGARMEEIGALDATAAEKFALMAIVRDRLPAMKARREAALADSADSPLAAQLAQEIMQLEEQRAEGAKAIVRKRHNYFPAFIAMLRALRDDGRLQAALDAAKKQAEEQAAREAARKAAAKK